MNVERTPVDLEALARPRGGEEIRRPRRRLMVWGLPLLVLLGFLGLAVFVGLEHLRPRVVVETARPVVVEAGASVRREGSVVTAAAGWVEPEPWPILVAPLEAGTIESLELREGDPVEEGQVVAHLVAEDAQLARDRIAALLDEARAGLETARARARFAKERLEASTDLRAAVRAAGARLEGAHGRTEAARAATEELEAAIAAAESELELERWLLEEEATEPRKVELAAARLAEVRARKGRLLAELAQARAEAEAAEVEVERAEEDLELRLELREAVAVAEAARAQAAAELAHRQAELAEAELVLSRMEVTSPARGVVLAERAAPGSGVGPEIPIYALYDPERLRIRVDVPLEEVARIHVGQKAEIVAESRRGEAYGGIVRRIVREADIQKVTLEVQVEVLEPDRMLTPEGLVQVRFLASAPETAAAEDEATDREAVLLPRAALREGHRVFVVQANGRVAARSVTVLDERDDRIVVEGAIGPADRVVVRADGTLEDGTAVRRKEEN